MKYYRSFFSYKKVCFKNYHYRVINEILYFIVCCLLGYKIFGIYRLSASFPSADAVKELHFWPRSQVPLGDAVLNDIPQTVRDKATENSDMEKIICNLLLSYQMN